MKFYHYMFCTHIHFQSRKRLYNHQCPFVCLSVRPSETKTPKQLKIIHFTLPHHSPPLTPSQTTSHTPSQHNKTSQHNITTQHQNTTSQHNIKTQHHNTTSHHNTATHNITTQHHHTTSHTPSQPSSSSSSISSFT